ncbi:MAG: PQQ-dependent sugar dehydrogenase [Chitinophagales bacterium]|nr:PQQ-dependent sugar dehydrogenase [Chitinophagales bacterium]MDW8427244.1 PQQ-dependent sugar dehydrogenase [Chitinophagales bacterium]
MLFSGFSWFLLLVLSLTQQTQLSFKARLHLVASGLEAPIGLEVANDGSNRLFVLEQKGTVRIIRDGQLLAEPFLDITDRVDKLNPMYSEKGLLGLAFHPQYKTNGRFFVYYSAPTNRKGINHRSILSEFRVSANPDRALKQERILLEIPQPESNHNGGQLAFGPDGYLYIGLGDGGGAGDKHGPIGNAQNLTNLLGKILRIDVDTAVGYRVPRDNPFVGTRARPEIWAYGLRNPWRFSFDRQTGELFCGDVGQNEFEEVNLIKRGRNYGWRIMEGFDCFNPPKDCNKSRLEPPIAVYSHREGRSVIGGYVYRGKKSPAWQGKYIFGDWTGKVFLLSKSAATGSWQRYTVTLIHADKEFYINSFGQDEAGEIYVVGQKGVGPSKSGSVWWLELL